MDKNTNFPEHLVTYSGQNDNMDLEIFWRYNESIKCKMVTEKHNAWIICKILNYRLEWQHWLTSSSHKLESFDHLLVTPSHIGPLSVSYHIDDLSFCAI